MAQNITYIVDDQDGSIDYLCPVTQQTVADSFFRNTWTSIRNLSCGGAWFQYRFNGTSVHISTRFSQVNSAYAVQVDDSPLLVQSGQGLYDSPTLSDGEHSVVYASGNQSLFPAFDFLTVTAGLSTSLRGRSIIVDDADSTLVYSGHWLTEPVSALALSYDTSTYLDTTHWSTAVGDSVSFEFTGTSVSVYGVIPFSNGNVGNAAAEYAIDGGKPTAISFPMGSNQSRTIPMAELFSVDSLEAGRHSVVLNVTDIPAVTNFGAFGLDFVVYNASFDSITDASSGVVPSSPSDAGALEGAHPNTGAIIGGVIGGVVFLLTLARLVLFLLRRRRIRKSARVFNVAMVSAPRKESFDSWLEGRTTKHESLTPPELRL